MQTAHKQKHTSADGNRRLIHLRFFLKHSQVPVDTATVALHSSQNLCHVS